MRYLLPSSGVIERSLVVAVEI